MRSVPPTLGMNARAIRDQLAALERGAGRMNNPLPDEVIDLFNLGQAFAYWGTKRRGPVMQSQIPELEYGDDLQRLGFWVHQLRQALTPS